MFLCDSQVKNTCYLVMCQGWAIFLECEFHEEPNASEEFDSDGILIAFVWKSHCMISEGGSAGSGAVAVCPLSRGHAESAAPQRQQFSACPV